MQLYIPDWNQIRHLRSISSALNPYCWFTIYSATSDKLGEAHFRIALWKKSTSPDPGYCITVWFYVDLDITTYQTAYAHSKHAYVLLCTMHTYTIDQNVCVARAMCALCLGPICRHWCEMLRKFSGIYWSTSTLSGENRPFSPCPVVALWNVNPAYCWVFLILNPCMLLTNTCHLMSVMRFLNVFR